MTDWKLEFWLRAPAPGPRLFAFATVVCFGGAFFTFAIEPWGTSVAAVLMWGWLALAAYCVIRDAELNIALDGTAARARASRRRSQIILRILVAIAPLAVLAYVFLLEHQGRPRDVVRAYQDAVLPLVVASYAVRWLIDWIYGRLTRASLLAPMKRPQEGAG